MRVVGSSVQELMAEGLVWTAQKSAKAKLCTPRVPFGVPEIDEALPEGGLSLGALHEFTLEHVKRGSWHPPFHIIAGILSNLSAAGLSSLPQRALLWIGRRGWPTPHLLEQISANIRSQCEPAELGESAGWDWTAKCLFIDPPSRQKLLWTAVQVLTSPCTAAAIIDASGLNFIATRRLQLAAQKHSPLVLLLRPPKELDQQSAARTKWRVTPVPSSSEKPAWQIELVQARSVAAPLQWNVVKGESSMLQAIKEEAPRTVSHRIGLAEAAG